MEENLQNSVLNKNFDNFTFFFLVGELLKLNHGDPDRVLAKPFDF